MKALWGSESRECHWPATPTLFCGDRTEEFDTYCPRHREVAGGSKTPLLQQLKAPPGRADLGPLSVANKNLLRGADRTPGQRRYSEEQRERFARGESAIQQEPDLFELLGLNR